MTQALIEIQFSKSRLVFKKAHSRSSSKNDFVGIFTNHRTAIVRFPREKIRVVAVSIYYS
jgi:hypothetical protein